MDITYTDFFFFFEGDITYTFWVQVEKDTYISIQFRSSQRKSQWVQQRFELNIQEAS